MEKYKDFGFLVCVAMVGLAIVRPASGIDPQANFEMLVYGLAGVLACLWRDHHKDKKEKLSNKKDEESKYLVDMHYQMQDYRQDRRNRE